MISVLKLSILNDLKIVDAIVIISASTKGEYEPMTSTPN
jgi:hypothetical protein